MTADYLAWRMFLTVVALLPACVHAADWEAGGEWKVAARDALSVSCDHETLAWNDSARPGTTWSVSADIKIAKTTNLVGSAKLVFAGAGQGPLVVVSVDRRRGGLSMLTVEVFEHSPRKILTSQWLPGGDSAYTVRLSRTGDCLSVVLYGDRQILFAEETPPIAPAIHRAIARFGIGAEAAEVQFSAVKFESPAVVPEHYTAQAQAAMMDLVKNFWSGGLGQGCIVPTSHGYRAADLPDPRGGLWERGMLIFAIDALYRANHDPLLRRRLELEWRRIKGLYTPEELEAAGTRIHPACDDSGWDARIYLTLYRHTRDPYALDRARGLISRAFVRWLDGELGGGMWYSNERKHKSLYQVGLIHSALQWEAVSGDKQFHDQALGCYDWIESRLLRSDGLYWCDIGREGPAGQSRPDDIHEAGSVVFLGGNMAMGVLHAWLYRATEDKKYLQRAVRTADAIAAKLVKEGVYLNDRDAWANGTFAADWADGVLVLPGIDRKHRDLLLRTADSIFQRARTPDGYYGGSWSGPAQGPGSTWCMKGSRPQQIMTSASSAMVIMAAVGVAPNGVTAAR
jgi:predicted alpha-1,6-mannanase (GH76 family)